MSDSPDRIPIERVLEHSGWVRALAHSLVHDADLAEDVVQQTWAAAIRTPPQSVEAIRPWLRVVVRNFAREAYRAMRTRERFERGGARAEAEPSTASLYESAELHEVVAAAVRRLPEKYGAVVMLRFHEGLPPRRIAEHLQIPLETVKTRLRRALTILRADLDDRGRERGTTRAAFLAPLVASLPAPPAGPGGPSGAAGRLVRWTMGATCVVIAAWIGATAAWDPRSVTAPSSGAADRTDSAGARRTRGRSDPPPASGASQGAAGAEAGAGGATDDGPTSANLAPAGRAEERIVLELAGAPLGAADLGRIPLTVVPIFADPKRGAGGPVEVVAERGTISVSAARWRDPANPLVSLDVTPEHPSLVHAASRVPVALRTGSPRAGSPVHIARAGIVTGRVSLPGGVHPEATVVALQIDQTVRRVTVVDSVVCAADGTFRLRLWPGEEHRIVAVTAGLTPATCVVAVHLDEPVDVGTLALTPGLTVSGQVHRPAGRARVGSGVVDVTAAAIPDLQIGCAGFDLGLYGPEVRFRSLRTAIGADGRYAAAGLAAGEHRISVIGFGRAGDLIDATARTALLPSDGIDIDVTGSPIEVIAPGVPDGGSVLVQPLAAIRTTQLTIVGERGTLVGSPGAKYELTALDVSGARLQGIAEPSAEDPDRRVELRRADTAPETSELVIAMPAGAGVPNLALYFYAPDAAANALPTLSLDAQVQDGIARILVPRTGRHRVVARPGTTLAARMTRYLDVTSVLDLAATVPARWELTPTIGGRLRILCHDARGRPLGAACRVTRDGSPVAVSFVHRDLRGLGTSQASLSLSGVTEIAGALPADTYSVDVTGPGGRVVALAAVVVAAEETIVTAVFGEP